MKDYYFNEDHQMFREGLKAFLDKEVKPNIDEWEEKQAIPYSIWEKFGDMGYMGINFPEKYGGMDADFFYSVIFLEEISKCWSGGFAITPVASHYMSVPYILKHGSEQLKDKYLPDLVAGRKISCIGISEPGCGSDAANAQTKAILDESGEFYVVNGAKTFITNSFFGDIVVAVVKTNPEAGVGGVSLLVIDLDSEGISKRRLKKLGWHASDTCELNFDEVKVPAENLIGQAGQGFYYLMQGLQLERLAASVMGYASCEEAVRYSLQYMSERKAFGRSINKFQVLRHRIAQLSSEIEAVKALSLHACRIYNDGVLDVKLCSMSKLLATELADKCMYQCLQFFGGYGFMEEYKMARAFRDARVGTIGGGTSEIMREILSKIIIDDMSYKPVSSAGSGASSNSSSNSGLSEDYSESAPLTVEAIFGKLPERFKKEKAGAFKANVHFDIAGDQGGQYTVLIDNGNCEVIEGHEGDRDCLVETDDETYIGVESGQLNAQTAFMTGKIKADNLGVMMQFSGLFKRLN
ncbi:MAG: acyl-CoA dehydrogenase family protein [Bacteroidetes bacterium]|nr:acyl-CoA dehydrogenase family protein [Bacteroidota bacterium]